MMGIFRLLPISGWIIVALSVALLTTSVAVKVQSSRLATANLEVTNCNLKIALQNQSIANWVREGEQQKELIAQAASDARSAARKWEARLVAAKSERPAVTPSDGPLAFCHGSMLWLRDQTNRSIEVWNASN